MSRTAERKSRPRTSTYTHPESRAFSLLIIGGPSTTRTFATSCRTICAPRARDLDPDRPLDAGRQHVDAVSDRRHPHVRQPRHRDDSIELLDQRLRRETWSPLVAGLELDGRLEHLERRRVRRRLGAAG